MGRIKLNILGLAEVRRKATGSMKLGRKTLIYSYERGVGTLFDETTAKKSGEMMSSFRVREVAALLVAKPLNLRIIQVYKPTSGSEDGEVKKFYEEIEKAKGYLKSQDIIIVMGDFIVKVGDERVEDVVGPVALGL
ncbi:craniofacial development protein 2-like protein [Plakobranchus ocellatus]|uniref:Craniofacial development protein 2-like protein n=1 Tax=Plakobranchus ocellatus TaxID=259542 RepID=A0AAV4ADN8_9GAST|nr:craniofacial development protein 2-like protein [Plakobranchus ocellatus]